MLTAWAWLCTGGSRVIDIFVHVHDTHITSLQVKKKIQKEEKVRKEVKNTTGRYKKKKKKKRNKGKV